MKLSDLISDAATLVRGENKALEYSIDKAGDPRVVLFNKMGRTIEHAVIKKLVKKIVNIHHDTKDTCLILDMFLIAFQTRNIRGGKGERAAFYKLYLELYTYFPTLTLRTIPLVSVYGYYKDYINLVAMIDAINSKSERWNKLRTHLLNHYVKQLMADFKTKKDKPISLCGKWAPRFHKQHHAIAKDLAILIYDKTTTASQPTIQANKGQVKKTYRKLVVSLTQRLKPVEIFMSAKKYSEIEFHKVTSNALVRYSQVFFKEREKDFLTALQTNSLKGGDLFPHQVYELLEKRTFQRLKESHREKLVESLWKSVKTKFVKNMSSKTMDWGNLLPVADVSGSMMGTPMNVAISLGLLLATMNPRSDFYNKLVTFSENPTFIELKENDSVLNHMKTIKRAPWGMNTNIRNVFELLIATIQKHNTDPKDVPDIVILSDMQFDAATSTPYTTTYEWIVKAFSKLNKTTGVNYSVPTIYFWNLRSDVIGLPVKTGSSGGTLGGTPNTHNVSMLSGFSPSMFEALLYGKKLTPVQKLTPYLTMRALLDNEQYLPVMSAIASK